MTPAARTTRRTRRAFTLLEMMLVLVIIGVLASVAALNLVGGADKARARATEATMKTLDSALQQYFFDTGAYPTTAQGLDALVPKYVQKPPLDGWKREMFYYSPGVNGNDFEIISLGKDALPDTEDDIRSWLLE
ncbi:MAG: type II secretion system major pseudopilin GspG [Phycisphaerales bacterium]|nr:type II secretion system major pseudopilin GspG [Phycisphaerales bacterium]